MSHWREERRDQRWEGGGWCQRGVAIGWLGSGMACRGDRVIKYWQRSHLVNRGAQGVRKRRGPVIELKTVWIEDRGFGGVMGKR